MKVEFNKQKIIEDRFDKAIKSEEEMGKKLVESKMALENSEKMMKEATEDRLKIQEEMRAAFLRAAHDLRDPGKFLNLVT